MKFTRVTQSFASKDSNSIQNLPHCLGIPAPAVVILFFGRGMENFLNIFMSPAANPVARRRRSKEKSWNPRSMCSSQNAVRAIKLGKMDVRDM